MCVYPYLASSCVNHWGIFESGEDRPYTIVLCFPILGCKLLEYTDTEV